MIATRTLVMAAVVSAAAAASAQQQPVFRTGVQIVEVDARVFDADGTFVTTLTAADFEVLEDGVPQTVVAAALVSGGSVGSARSTGSEPAAVEPGERPAPVEPRGSRGSQTWIFFFDLNHLTPGGGFDRAKAAAEAFLREQLPAGDMAGIVAGDKMIGGRLTSNRSELLSYIRQVKPRGESRARTIEMTREWPRFRNEEEVLEVVRRIDEVRQRVVTRACSDDPDACMMAESMVEQKAARLASTVQKETNETFAALNGLATGLSRVPGPKTVVFLSNGFPSFGLENTLRTVVGQAARSGARVYAIDVRGLNRGGMGDRLDAAAFDDAAGGPPAFDALENGVNSLAVDTGGLMIRNENNINRALTRVAADAGTYYVIGYQPSNTVFDGKYRKIEVRVKTPGLRVRARQGYLALEPSKMLVPERIR